MCEIISSVIKPQVNEQIHSALYVFSKHGHIKNVLH